MNKEDTLNLRLLTDTKCKVLIPSIKSMRDRRRALGKGTGAARDIISILIKYMTEMYASTDKEILKLASRSSLIKVMGKVPGCDTISAAHIIAYIPRPEDYDTVSAIWSYAGFNPSMEYPKFNPSLRAAVYRLVPSLISNNRAYHKIYKEHKEKYRNRDWEAGRVELASMRMVAKIYLMHLHETARKLAGRNTNLEQSIELHGEENIYKKESFGWK